MDKKRHITIFTTASLPWLTGTAVNPLFRAAYLANLDERKVTLVVPWLKLKDQEHVYPNNITFDSPQEQENYVRQWLHERTGLKSNFEMRFYPGRFSLHKRSILALGDITEVIPDEKADVAVLEEPEHLTWYHHGKRWKTKFRLVVGVVHTNYLEYVRREKNGEFQAFLLKYMNNWVVYIYCHRVIRLSAATQELPRSIICNVHGVNPKFLETGAKKREQQQDGIEPFTKGAYYIGKMVWSKGYKELLKLLSDHQNELQGLEVDLYGSGEDSTQVAEAAKKLNITVRVFPGRDHTDPLFHDYKVFLNPSTTDVVCTTTAEALAMGKIVVCANHPSNEFFKQFPNCRTYDTSDEFVKETCKALQDQPAPQTDAQLHTLSWEAATERFLESAQLDSEVKKMAKSPSKKLLASTSINVGKNLEDASAMIHHVGTAFLTKEPDEEMLQKVGLPVSAKKQSNPSRKWAF
ncbi:digalactosyldiacylglycerol synthase 2, chloroplastic [Andrographis paniculata]|uniref:digalactosyldiacylglycerol synthase 2, chloroplastic n=1 Tax=Andrographis paniculata TaxID=175694 RepID=UPI0021E92135|nr:digalactosyldiacylglycerol synthase 2, chloroplastic [Andrographis paniculata]